MSKSDSNPAGACAPASRPWDIVRSVGWSNVNVGGRFGAVGSGPGREAADSIVMPYLLLDGAKIKPRDAAMNTAVPYARDGGAQRRSV
jgi:hypothetical protein